MSAQIPRRSVLQATGLGSAVAISGRTTASAAAPRSAGYRLQNGYFRLIGSYGKLTELAVDPAGKGHYEKATCQAVYLGSIDRFDAQYNAGVKATLSATELRLTGISLPMAHPLTQDQTNGASPPVQPGHTLGQAFTVTAERFAQIGIQLQTLSAVSGATLTLYAGAPGSSLRRLFGKRIPKITTNGWVYVDIPPQPAGSYYIELSDPSGKLVWSVLRSNALATGLGGSAFIDRAPTSEWICTLTVDGYDLDATAHWRIVLDGSRLTSTFGVTPTDSAPTTPLTLVTPWQRSGYSIAYDDDVLFSRFFTDSGRYLPIQQLKRQTSFSMKLPTAQWVYATGTGPYDLRISMPGIMATSPSTEDSMSLTMIRTATTDIASDSPLPPKPLTIEVLPHTDAVPDFYPRFTASDQTRADQLNSFFYERAYSHSFSNSADYKDWENRVLDWSDTGGIAALRKSLLIDTKITDDGYVWAWSIPGWPWPNPSFYDTRHYATNVMFVLAVHRLYSWTGDRDFLSAALPRMRKVLNYVLNDLHGYDGMLKMTSPEHTGFDQALGSNYWDITSYGYLSAYENAYFYGALLAAAAVERHVGSPSRGGELKSLARTVRKNYSETFWDETAGRYIGCVDAQGNRHDYGSTYVNVEAASFGLPYPQQAERILSWLDSGHIETTDNLVLIEEAGPTSSLLSSHTLGQTFAVEEPFTQVGARYVTAGNEKGEFTLALYAGGPGGTKLAETRVTRCWDYAWPHLDVEPQPAGTYYLEFSDPVDTVGWSDGADGVPGGSAFADGVATQTPASRSIIVLSPYKQGPADIYDRWVFAPRSTTRRNNFWYSFTWHPWVPWEEQLQDGGTSLYISGFDVISRSHYRGGDDAWARLSTILDRWSEPDHVCGGDPLFRGEHPQGAAAGAVGTDTAFPESGLAPASFLYGILGVEVTPDAMEITPRLPAQLEHAGIERMYWRGRYMNLLITRSRVTLNGPDVQVDEPYQNGQTIRVPAPRVW